MFLSSEYGISVHEVNENGKSLSSCRFIHINNQNDLWESYDCDWMYIISFPKKIHKKNHQEHFTVLHRMRYFIALYWVHVRDKVCQNLSENKHRNELTQKRKKIQQDEKHQVWLINTEIWSLYHLIDYLFPWQQPWISILYKCVWKMKYAYKW